MAKQVLISGLEQLQLGIPQRSIRGPYCINMDAAYVDLRCLNRYLRRFHNLIWRR